MSCHSRPLLVVRCPLLVIVFLPLTTDDAQINSSPAPSPAFLLRWGRRSRVCPARPALAFRSASAEASSPRRAFPRPPALILPPVARSPSSLLSNAAAPDRSG